MPAATHEDDLIRLAAAVSSRERFEAIFDQVRTPGTSLPFKVLALLDTQRPYLKSYHHAKEIGFGCPSTVLIITKNIATKEPTLMRFK